MRSRSILAAFSTAAVLTTASVGRTQGAPAAPAAEDEGRAPKAPDPEPTQDPKTDAPKSAVVPAGAQKREEDLTPAPAQTPPASAKVKFTADPVADGAVIAISLTFGLLTNAILSTDEIRPQQTSPTFDSQRLLGIDRGAIHQTISSSAGTLSNIGLWGSVGFAALDSVLDGLREGRSAAQRSERESGRSSFTSIARTR